MFPGHRPSLNEVRARTWNRSYEGAQLAGQLSGLGSGSLFEIQLGTPCPGNGATQSSQSPADMPPQTSLIKPFLSRSFALRWPPLVSDGQVKLAGVHTSLQSCPQPPRVLHGTHTLHVGNYYICQIKKKVLLWVERDKDESDLWSGFRFASSILRAGNQP